MKRFIKSSGSDYSPEMWDKVRKQAPNGYLYIFKHGVGPGTIPDDVKVLKWKDLPNYYTAVWLDRWLDADELKEYDIPSETDINYYLDRIGYCKKDGDVVPCGEEDIFEGIPLGVEACGDIKASTEIPKDADLPTFKEFATSEWTQLNDGSCLLKLRDLFVSFGTDKQWNASDPCCWYVIKVKNKIYKESRPYAANKHESCYKAMQKAVKKLLETHVEACGDIKASTEPKYMANMVSCSSEDAYYDDNFLVEGYYDNQYRGLAESAETSDVSALNEYINDYANRGYFIKVHNLTDGTITQFSPDNWFDDIARDGGAELFMS